MTLIQQTFLFFFCSYGLLGPSGCGKTTLLSSIVGRSELDSGDIMVKAFKREDIGYMPQVRIFQRIICLEFCTSVLSTYYNGR